MESGSFVTFLINQKIPKKSPKGGDEIERLDLVGSRTIQWYFHLGINRVYLKEGGLS